MGARILLEARSEAQKQAGEAMEMDMDESDSEEETEQQIQHEVRTVNYEINTNLSRATSKKLEVLYMG